MDQRLQVFITVAEKENFSRAAEAHHMTQPAVSQYIRSLEDEIGTRLLERTNKYVRLNKAGEIIYQHGKEIIGLYTKMQNLVDDLTQVATGPITIGASYTFGEYVLPCIIANLLKSYPDIDPTITIANTAKIAELVGSHQLDIGIIEGHFNDQQLITENFATDEMVVIASANHPLAQRENAVSPIEIAKETWIVREAGSGTREAAEKLFTLLELTPHKKMHFSSTQLMKESVKVGLGISLISRWAVKQELKNEELKVINVEGLPLTRQFSIITKSHFQTKALEVFISLLHSKKSLT